MFENSRLVAARFTTAAKTRVQPASANRAAYDGRRRSHDEPAVQRRCHRRDAQPRLSARQRNPTPSSDESVGGFESEKARRVRGASLGPAILVCRIELDHSSGLLELTSSWGLGPAFSRGMRLTPTALAQFDRALARRACKLVRRRPVLRRLVLGADDILRTASVSGEFWTPGLRSSSSRTDGRPKARSADESAQPLFVRLTRTRTPYMLRAREVHRYLVPVKV